MSEPILAWHFLPPDGCLTHRTKRRKVTVGDLFIHQGPLVMCRSGLHASTDLLDALRHAPGPILCRVQMSGEVKIGFFKDKVVATRRKVLWMVDATNTLHEFACRCAERALLREREADREPDPRSWAAVVAKRAWMRGEMPDEELDAAAAVANAVAWAAAVERDWQRTTLLALVEERRLK